MNCKKCTKPKCPECGAPICEGYCTDLFCGYQLLNAPVIDDNYPCGGILNDDDEAEWQNN